MTGIKKIAQEATAVTWLNMHHLPHYFLKRHMEAWNECLFWKLWKCIFLTIQDIKKWCMLRWKLSPKSTCANTQNTQCGYVTRRAKSFHRLIIFNESFSSFTRSEIMQSFDVGIEQSADVSIPPVIILHNPLVSLGFQTHWNYCTQTSKREKCINEGLGQPVGPHQKVEKTNHQNWPTNHSTENQTTSSLNGASETLRETNHLLATKRVVY